jgi:hypothetical protein
MPYAIGVDLGRQQDPSAIAICETKPAFTLSGQRLPTVVNVTHLERLPLGTSYDLVRTRVQKLAETLYFLDPDLCVDAGGPGRPVIDDLRAKGVVRVIAVTSTGGTSESRVKVGPNKCEDWNVSKAVLLGALSSLVYGERLKVANSLAEARQLHIELQSLEHRVSDAGRETFTVATGADHHADLVSAVSLACWRLLRPRIVGRAFKLQLLSR